MLKRILFIGLCILSLQILSVPAKAQCSMCSLNAEQGTQHGNTQGVGLNNGILYLLAIPYVLVGAVGILWYRNYRKKAIETPA